MPAPANDNIANRQVLSGDAGSITPVTIDDATTEASEPIASHADHNQTVWFEWTPAADGLAEFSTQGSVATDGNGDSHGGLDTTLAVWTGDPTDFATFVEAASNDDDSSLGAGHWTSRVRFFVTGGTTYFIQVGTYDTPYTGTLHLGFSRIDVTLVGPGNDSCGNAYELVGTSGHVEATNEGWAGVWPTGADPLFTKYGVGGGAPLWFFFDNSAGTADVQLLVVPAPGAINPVTRIQEGVAVGTCGTLDLDAGEGFYVRSRTNLNPAPGATQIDVIIPAGEIGYLELDSYSGDGTEPPDASGDEGGFAFDWTVTATSTQDCVETAVSLGDPLDGRTTMTEQLYPGGGGSIGNDLSRHYHSILVGDVLYWAMEVDYYDPFTGDDLTSTKHYDFVVGKINTDGTGLETHVVDPHLYKDLDNYPGKNVIHTAGGGFSGAIFDEGEMRLLYDGVDVVVAILTKEGHTGSGAFTRHYVDLYREDGGAWTHITELVSQDSVGADTFQSFQATASPAVPGTIWVGMAGQRFVDGAGTLEDRFTRYSIDVATGVATVLYDGYSQSITEAGLTVVSGGAWELCSDEGYPILIWQKNSFYANDNPEGLPVVVEDRQGYDAFVTVERFDTKALIRTITSDQATAGAVSAAYILPQGEGAGQRSRSMIRTWPRFFCAETGEYERFVALRYMTVVGGASTNPETWLFRIKSDFTAVPRPIDSTAFNPYPGTNPQTFNPVTSHFTWGWQTPLYDGLRNVWEVGISYSGNTFAMFQFDRRCQHQWLNALNIEGVVGIDTAQDGGWDEDGYFYVANDGIGYDWKLWKIGPVLRDCVTCIPITPLVSGLYAWQKF